MKKITLLILVLVSLFTNSCSNSGQATSILDDYKLLTVTSEGKIFEIGNVTGNTELKGHITNQSNLIQLSTICNIGSKIYALESSYVPSPNILLIYNKVTDATTTQQLILPTSVTSTMSDPFITNIEYNGFELIAVVSENMPDYNHPNKIISINLTNYQTTDLGINFFQRTLTSTELINDDLYISTRSEGLIKIDLTQKTVTELQANGIGINATRLVKIGSTKLGIMKLGVPYILNGVQPFEYDLTNNTLSDKSSGINFAVGNITGGTIYKNNEYVNFVFTTTSQFGILKINYLNNETKFIPIDPNILGANALIIDTIQ